MKETVRPTKKQRELLGFIEDFIAEHGYSPSYREIMQGLQYNSVATVALHINNLVVRGHLKKRDNSARSLEIRAVEPAFGAETSVPTAAEEKWFVEQVDSRFRKLEVQKNVKLSQLDTLYVLVGALRILGFEGAAQSFIDRLGDLQKASKP